MEHGAHRVSWGEGDGEMDESAEAERPKDRAF